jgi:hypothetical protein
MVCVAFADWHHEYLFVFAEIFKHQEVIDNGIFRLIQKTPRHMIGERQLAITAVVREYVRCYYLFVF